jgi:hypothetical protein
MDLRNTVFTLLKKKTVTSAVREFNQVCYWMWELQLEYPLHAIS